MSDQLTPCAGCARHIRLSERACPFCATTHAPIDAPPLVDAPSGLSRAAMLVLGASLALAGCERPANNPNTQPTMQPATTPIASQPSSADIYGAPPPPMPPAPAYGLPPPPSMPLPPGLGATIYGGPPPPPTAPRPGSSTPPGSGTPAP